MFLIGLELLKFIPRRGERPEVWFQRFDITLETANRVFGLEFSITFPSWMLFSLFQLSFERWAGLLKDMGHALPNTREQYVGLRRAMFRDRALEGSSFDFRQGARGVFGSASRSYFTVGDACECRFLYLCFGDPGGNDIVEAFVRFAIEDGDGGRVDVYDGHFSVEGDVESGVCFDEAQWQFEGEVDPIQGVELVGLQRGILEQVAHLHWCMRNAIVKFRVIKGRFSPRRSHKVGRFKRRFFRRGPAGRKGGKGRTGLYCGEVFVSLDEVPDGDLQVFVKEGEEGGDTLRCFKCGRPVHIAVKCPCPQELCLNCNRSGHMVAQCPANGANVVSFVPSSFQSFHFPAFTVNRSPVDQRDGVAKKGPQVPTVGGPVDSDEEQEQQRYSTHTSDIRFEFAVLSASGILHAAFNVNSRDTASAVSEQPVSKGTASFLRSTNIGNRAFEGNTHPTDIQFIHSCSSFIRGGVRLFVLIRSFVQVIRLFVQTICLFVQVVCIFIQMVCLFVRGIHSPIGRIMFFFMLATRDTLNS